MADTYSTLLHANGTNEKMLRELVRHSNLSTNLNLHTQAVSEQKRAAHPPDHLRNRLAAFFLDCCGQRELQQSPRRAVGLPTSPFAACEILATRVPLVEQAPSKSFVHQASGRLLSVPLQAGLISRIACYRQ